MIDIFGEKDVVPRWSSLPSNHIVVLTVNLSRSMCQNMPLFSKLFGLPNQVGHFFVEITKKIHFKLKKIYSDTIGEQNLARQH